MDRVCFFKSDCYEHASHLCTLGGLKIIDHSLKNRKAGWKYYSSLAILCNTIRDICKPLFESWRQLFGESSAVEKAHKMFPSCCSGRWGSCHVAEKRFLASGIDKLAPALERALLTKTKANASDGPVTTSVNDIAIDESKAYSQKMGKWRRASLDRVSDPIFWKLLAVANRAREPLIHLSNFLKVKLTDTQLSDLGGHLSQLTCGKANQIAYEFDDLFLADRWRDIVEGLPKSDADWLMSLAACLVANHACAFHRRVFQKVTSFPERLFLLVKADFNIPDSVRQHVAQEVLDLSPSAIDPETDKVRRAFKLDLAQAAAYGVCGLRFSIVVFIVLTPASLTGHNLAWVHASYDTHCIHAG